MYLVIKSEYKGWEIVYYIFCVKVTEILTTVLYIEKTDFKNTRIMIIPFNTIELSSKQNIFYIYKLWKYSLGHNNNLHGYNWCKCGVVRIRLVKVTAY